MLRVALALLAAVSLSAPAAFAQGSTTFTGTVTGPEGDVLPVAHVHALSPGAETAAAAVLVGTDGRFALSTDHTGFLVVRFTGADHRPLDLPLYLGEGEEVELAARLAVNPLADDLSEVRVQGDFPGSGRTLKPQPDGTYAETFRVKADTLAYQLSESTTHGRRVNGTDYDRLVYDGDGDYLSVLDVEGDSVTITFDPRRVPRSDVMPAVDFADPNAQAARVAAVLRGLDNRSERVYRVRRRALLESQGRAPEERQAALETALTPFELPAEDTRLAATILAETDPVVRQALLLNYVSVETELEEKDPALALQALREIGPDARLWSLQPALVQRTLDLAALADSAATEAAARALYDRHPDPEVQGYVLLGSLESADRAGDEGRAEATYALLQEERFAETTPALIASAVFVQYDTEGAIAVGALVPDFTLALLDAEGEVSREGLLGTTYLIDFWAVWCAPCIAEMPTLHAAYERFNDEGFEILSISMDDIPDQVRAFRTEHFPMPWLNVFAEGGFAGDLAERFEVGGLPKPILVGPDGRILALTSGKLRGALLERTLAELFGSEEGEG